MGWNNGRRVGGGASRGGGVEGVKERVAIVGMRSVDGSRSPPSPTAISFSAGHARKAPPYVFSTPMGKEREARDVCSIAMRKCPRMRVDGEEEIDRGQGGGGASTDRDGHAGAFKSRIMSTGDSVVQMHACTQCHRCSAPCAWGSVVENGSALFRKRASTPPLSPACMHACMLTACPNESRVQHSAP